MTNIILLLIAFYLDWRLGLATLALIVVDYMKFIEARKRVIKDLKELDKLFEQIKEKECKN
jgi:hypothetical protein